MHEVLHATAGMRLPVTMTVANRALSAPLNIWNDHSDSMSQRDTSWLQFYAETVQEAVDLQIQAFKIAESIQLPAMVCMDGYVLTHTYEPVMIPDQSDVDSFLPPFELDYKLDTTNPVTLGAYATPDDYMEFKYEQQLAMDEAKDEIKKVNKEFDSIFGREYGNGMIELFGMDEAEVALIAMGSVCGTIKDAIEGTNCGLIRIRSYRPFPAKELKKAVKGLRAVGVIDRAFSYGFGGPLFSEVKSTVDGVAIKNFIAGLGGRDIRIQDIRDMTAKLESKEEIVWINLKDYGRG
jgi:pyruvate ferredoxin oxidoreductase alpha subunit